MSALAKAVGGASFLSGTLWLSKEYSTKKKKTSHLSDTARGPLWKRIVESARMYFNNFDKEMPYDHQELVSSLPCRSFVRNRRPHFQQEILRFAHYREDYLTSTQTPLDTPVFRYTHLPILPKEQHSMGFLFSGNLEGLFDLATRTDLLRGDYVRCAYALPVKDPETSQYVHHDVILTGTTGNQPCRQFDQDLFDQAVQLSAHSNLDEDHPLARTSVFVGSKKVGSLGEDYGPVSKQNAREGNYVRCQDYLDKETHTREAIVTGTLNEKACIPLYTDEYGDVPVSTQRSNGWSAPNIAEHPAGSKA